MPAFFVLCARVFVNILSVDINNWRLSRLTFSCVVIA